MSPEQLRAFQLQHYAERLSQERAKGNTAAVMFLRNELCNLKKLS